MAELKRQITIINDLGLHARAAAKLVQLANKFPVEVTISRDDMDVNAKSIMGVLMLAAAEGTDLVFTCVGDDGVIVEAMDAMFALINGRFGEDR